MSGGRADIDNRSPCLPETRQELTREKNGGEDIDRIDVTKELIRHRLQRHRAFNPSAGDKPIQTLRPNKRGNLSGDPGSGRSVR